MTLRLRIRKPNPTNQKWKAIFCQDGFFNWFQTSLGFKRPPGTKNIVDQNTPFIFGFWICLEGFVLFATRCTETHSDPLFGYPNFNERTFCSTWNWALILDKSPKDDGSPTVCYRRSGGPNSRLIIVLHEVFDTLWEDEAAAWEQWLLQPIFKGGEKDPADTASCRGTYLSSALAKRFEGILIHRLTQYTETHNMLTENQLGTRPGRQVYDVIYTLLSVIQDKKKDNLVPMWHFLTTSQLFRRLIFGCVY